MNNAKMWLVVKPTVGIPLCLSAVAVGSFAVPHAGAVALHEAEGRRGLPGSRVQPK